MISVVMIVLLDDLDEEGIKKFPTMGHQKAEHESVAQELLQKITGQVRYGHRLLKGITYEVH